MWYVLTYIYIYIPSFKGNTETQFPCSTQTICMYQTFMENLKNHGYFRSLCIFSQLPQIKRSLYESYIFDICCLHMYENYS